MLGALEKRLSASDVAGAQAARPAGRHRGHPLRRRADEAPGQRALNARALDLRARGFRATIHRSPAAPAACAIASPPGHTRFISSVRTPWPTPPPPLKSACRTTARRKSRWRRARPRGQKLLSARSAADGSTTPRLPPRSARRTAWRSSACATWPRPPRTPCSGARSTAGSPSWRSWGPARWARSTAPVSTRMGRDVAVRILRSDRALEDSAKGRFLREARAQQPSGIGEHGDGVRLRSGRVG